MTSKQGDTHRHNLKQAYKKDVGVPGNEDYDKGPRFLRLWVCVTPGCKHTEAFDLTHDNPGGSNDTRIGTQ